MRGNNTILSARWITPAKTRLECLNNFPPLCVYVDEGWRAEKNNFFRGVFNPIRPGVQDDISYTLREEECPGDWVLPYDWVPGKWRSGEVCVSFFGRGLKFLKVRRPQWKNRTYTNRWVPGKEFQWKKLQDTVFEAALDYFDSISLSGAFCRCVT